MILKTLFHLLMVIHYVAIIYFKATVVRPPVQLPAQMKTFGGPWKFLTHWNLCFQLLYFTIALLNSLFGTESSARNGSSRLQKLRDYLFSSVAFPFGIFVTVTFWMIYFYNDELMWPQFLRKIFPPLANHMMHTAPAIGQLIELGLVNHIYPKRSVGLATCGSVALAYLVWICIIAHYGGFWVYPFLGVMSTPVRTVFITVCAIMSGLLYAFGETMNSLVWASVSDAQPAKVAKDNAKKSETTEHHYATRSKTKVRKAD